MRSARKVKHHAQGDVQPVRELDHTKEPILGQDEYYLSNSSYDSLDAETIFDKYS